MQTIFPALCQVRVAHVARHTPRPGPVRRYVRCRPGQRRISGLVRPKDVSTDNIVFSRKIANARIYYGGGGVIAESNAKGWLTRLFDSPMFPL